MQHRTAKETLDHRGFHMVVGQHPVGYCAEHDPHPTELEARECFARYQREHVVAGGKCSWSTCMVGDCKQPAENTWRIEGDGYALAVLCTDHNAAEHAIEVMHLNGPAGDSWFS